MQTTGSFSSPLVFAVCGWSGSGKTRLLERLVAHFNAQGLSVGVVKHDAHRLTLDCQGKDTDRLWQAGAHQLVAHDAEQVFVRARKTGAGDVDARLTNLCRKVDFVLLEGHKNTAFDKLWLEHPDNKEQPDGLQNIIDILPWAAENRVEFAVEIITKWLPERWLGVPLRAGVLAGGRSKRMGRPKSALSWRGKTLLEFVIDTVSEEISDPVLLGEAPLGGGSSKIERIPDIAGCAGPMAGMLSAMRWAPNRGWLFAACDMPLISVEALQWLQSQRKQGRWVVLPCIDDCEQPLLAIYEPQASAMLECAYATGNFTLLEALKHPKTYRVDIPQELKMNWTNCNTAAEWNVVQNQFGR